MVAQFSLASSCVWTGGPFHQEPVKQQGQRPQKEICYVKIKGAPVGEAALFQKLYGDVLYFSRCVFMDAAVSVVSSSPLCSFSISLLLATLTR